VRGLFGIEEILQEHDKGMPTVEESSLLKIPATGRELKNNRGSFFKEPLGCCAFLIYGFDLVQTTAVFGGVDGSLADKDPITG
jgi:hypothetical protein